MTNENILLFINKLLLDDFSKKQVNKLSQIILTFSEEIALLNNRIDELRKGGENNV